VDKHLELLVAMYTADDDLTQAALDRGGAMGLPEDQTLDLLERLWDDSFIKRRKQLTGSGSVNLYRVERITQAGVEAVEHYIQNPL